MATTLTQALDALREERDAAVARVAALEVVIAQLMPLVNPQDVPAGRPIVIPDPKLAPKSVPEGNSLDGWVCDQCGYQAASKNGLGIHRASKHGIKSDYVAKRSSGEFACEVCGRTFSKPNGLNRHRNETHGIPTDNPHTVASAKSRAKKAAAQLAAPPAATVGEDVQALRCDDCEFLVTLDQPNAMGKLTAHIVGEHRRSPSHDERTPRTGLEVAS